MGMVRSLSLVLGSPGRSLHGGMPVALLGVDIAVLSAAGLDEMSHMVGHSIPDFSNSPGSQLPETAAPVLGRPPAAGFLLFPCAQHCGQLWP